MVQVVGGNLTINQGLVAIWGYFLRGVCVNTQAVATLALELDLGLAQTGRLFMMAMSGARCVQ